VNDAEIKIFWVRFIRNMERKYLLSITAAIAAQFQQYISTQNIQAIDAQGLHDVLLKLRKEAAVVWGHKVQLQLRNFKNRRPMGFSERIYELMKEYFGIDLLNDSEGITDTTREYIRMTLERAALNGSSFDDIVKELSNTELSKRRARVIARTETIGAANKASITVARDAGILLNKKWLSVHDARTRHDHMRVDGTTIPMEELYKVGVYAMDHPGDKGGEDGRLPVPAKEVVNCRCTQTYVPVFDSNGRVVSL
jgi:uncharacterized protein with gpF-like domain